MGIILYYIFFLFIPALLKLIQIGNYSGGLLPLVWCFEAALLLGGMVAVFWVRKNQVFWAKALVCLILAFQVLSVRIDGFEHGIAIWRLFSLGFNFVIRGTRPEIEFSIDLINFFVLIIFFFRTKTKKSPERGGTV